MAVYKTKVADLPKNILEEAQIPEKYFEDEVLFVEKNSRSNTGAEVYRQLNMRLVRAQLGLENQEVDKRGLLWYTVRLKLGGVIDLKGDSDQQYISVSEMFKGFCDEIARHLGFEYWAFVPDYLGVPTKDIAIFVDSNLNTKAMTVEQIENLKETPYFIVTCEKMGALNEFITSLKNRGYKRGYLGFYNSQGGYTVSSTVKLLIALKKRVEQEGKKFAVFNLMDYDLNGMQIHLDMKKWFDCEPIGVTPDMLNYCFDEAVIDKFKENYNPKNIEKLITGVENMVNDLDITQEDKEKYISWASEITKQRIELNAVLAYRSTNHEEQAQDFVKYFIEVLLPNRTWDLNKDEKPSVSRPSYISEIIQKLESEATKTVDKYLSDKNLRYSNDWIEAIPKLKQKYEEFIAENSEYKDDLTNTRKLINKQSKELEEILKKSELYSDVETELDELSEAVIKKLELNDNDSETTEEESDETEDSDTDEEEEEK